MVKKNKKAIKKKVSKKSKLPVKTEKDITDFHSKRHHVEPIECDDINSQHLIVYSIEETEFYTLIGQAKITVELSNGKTYSGNIDFDLESESDEFQDKEQADENDEQME